MSQSELQRLFATFKTSAFRLEALPQYNIKEEKPIYDAYLRGVPSLPDADLVSGWLSFIARQKQSGKTMTTVRLLTSPLTPYLRYQIDWCYPPRADAGDIVKFLLPGSIAKIEGALQIGDYWLFDKKALIKMNYDEVGRFLGIEPIETKSVIQMQVRVSAKLEKESLTLKDFLSKYRSAKVL